MAQVSVSIGGRAYRLACNPGEEAHLEGLAATVDKKIAEMRESFGEIGDQRLIVMAALTIADEVNEAQSSARREAQRAEAALADAEAAHAETTEARLKRPSAAPTPWPPRSTNLRFGWAAWRRR